VVRDDKGFALSARPEVESLAESERGYTLAEGEPACTTGHSEGSGR